MEKILVLVKKEEDYLDNIFKILLQSEEKICYVTFNKTPGYILELAEKKGISKKRFYFLDCLSARMQKIIKMNNVTYLTDFYNLKKLNKNIKQVVKKGFGLIILDSFSNIFIYGAPEDQFITSSFKDLFKEIEGLAKKAVFICFEKDIENYSLNNFLGLFSTFVKPLSLFGS